MEMFSQSDSCHELNTVSLVSLKCLRTSEVSHAVSVSLTTIDYVTVHCEDKNVASRSKT